MTALVLFAIAALMNVFLPGEYLVPCLIAYFISQVYMYMKAAREEKKKNASK